MKPLRAVTYARVSTLKKSQDTSIKRQTVELKEAAERRRWKVIEQLSDRISGGRNDREGMRAAVDLVVRGRADVLVVHDLDRLGRDVRELLANVDAIDAAGGNLLVLSLAIDTSTPAGRLAFTMAGAIAEFVRRDTVRKVIAGLAYARKKGVRLGRPPKLSREALTRAVALRTGVWHRGRVRRRPMSWRLIALVLKRERLGRHPDPTVAGAVTRELERTKQRSSSRTLDRTTQARLGDRLILQVNRRFVTRSFPGPPKTPTKTTRKNPEKRRGSRNVAKRI